MNETFNHTRSREVFRHNRRTIDELERQFRSRENREEWLRERNDRFIERVNNLPESIL